MIYKYCMRCGKRLKGEENRLRGYGKICFEKARQEARGMTPLITPTHAQAQREIKRLQAEEQNARARVEEISKARARLQAMQEKSQEQSKTASQGARKNLQEQVKRQEGQPPHLEKTLTPTYKTSSLFIPHT